MTQNLNVFRSSSLRMLVESLDLRIMDIGARGGVDEEFFPAAWATTAIGFEPEPAECAVLSLRPPAPWRAVRYFPVAIGGKNGSALLYVPGNPSGASLLKHNPEMIDLYGYNSLHCTKHSIEVTTLTLDTARERFGVKADYIKIDVEGAELDILRSAPNTLSDCSAIKVEVSFLEQREKQPLVCDVYDFLLSSGYILAEIRGIHQWRRRPMPAHPFSADCAIPYSKGIAAQCDLVFLKNYRDVSEEDILIRLVLTSSIIGYFDYAITMIRSCSRIEEKLSSTGLDHFLKELGLISKKIGRTVALTEIKSRLRSMLPLLKSAGPGIAVDEQICSGY